MIRSINYTEDFFSSLNVLTGIPVSKIKTYAKENNPFNIIEHPNVISPNPLQLEKISKLREFMASYNILRMEEEKEIIRFKSPEDAGNYFTSLLSTMKDKERFLVAFLDVKHGVIETKIVSEGSTSDTMVYPRQILQMALANDCAGILLSHNHPSCTTSPSSNDLAITKNMINIFKPLNINVVDHIIVAGTNYISLARSNLLPELNITETCYDPLPLFEDQAPFDINQRAEKSNETVIGDETIADEEVGFVIRSHC